MKNSSNLNFSKGLSLIEAMVGLLVISFGALTIMNLPKFSKINRTNHKCDSIARSISNKIAGDGIVPSILSQFSFDNDYEFNSSNMKFLGLTNERIFIDERSYWNKFDKIKLVSDSSEINPTPPYKLGNSFLVGGAIRTLTSMYNDTNGQICNNLMEYKTAELAKTLETELNLASTDNISIQLSVTPYNLDNPNEIYCDFEKILIKPRPSNPKSNAFSLLNIADGSPESFSPVLTLPEGVFDNYGMRLKVRVIFLDSGTSLTTENTEPNQEIGEECISSRDFRYEDDKVSPKITGLYLLDNLYTKSPDGGGVPSARTSGGNPENYVSIALQVQKSDLEAGTVYFCKDLSGKLDLSNSLLKNPPCLDSNMNHSGKDAFGSWIYESKTGSVTNPPNYDSMARNTANIRLPNLFKTSPTDMPQHSDSLNPWSLASNPDWMPCDKVTLCGEKPYEVLLNSDSKKINSTWKKVSDRLEKEKIERVSILMKYKIPANKYCHYDMAAIAIDTSGNGSHDTKHVIIDGNIAKFSPPNLRDDDNHSLFTRLRVPQSSDGNNNEFFPLPSGYPKLLNDTTRAVPQNLTDVNSKNKKIFTSVIDGTPNRSIKYDANFAEILGFTKPDPTQDPSSGQVSEKGSLFKLPQMCSYQKRCQRQNKQDRWSADFQSRYPDGYLTPDNHCCHIKGACSVIPDGVTPITKPKTVFRDQKNRDDFIVQSVLDSTDNQNISSNPIKFDKTPVDLPRHDYGHNSICSSDESLTVQFVMDEFKKIAGYNMHPNYFNDQAPSEIIKPGPWQQFMSFESCLLENETIPVFKLKGFVMPLKDDEIWSADLNSSMSGLKCAMKKNGNCRGNWVDGLQHKGESCESWVKNGNLVGLSETNNSENYIKVGNTTYRFCSKVPFYNHACSSGWKPAQNPPENIVQALFKSRAGYKLHSQFYFKNEVRWKRFISILECNSPKGKEYKIDKFVSPLEDNEIFSLHQSGSRQFLSCAMRADRSCRDNWLDNKKHGFSSCKRTVQNGWSQALNHELTVNPGRNSNGEYFCRPK